MLPEILSIIFHEPATNILPHGATMYSFVVTFFFLTYYLNRPCVYCSILLLILFVSSCYWSDSCFFDLNADWFEPRHISSVLSNPLDATVSHNVPAVSGGGVQGGGRSLGEEEVGFLVGVVNETVKAAGAAAVGGMRRNSGVGLEWIRSWLGGREWRVPCLDVNIRL